MEIDLTKKINIRDYKQATVEDLGAICSHWINRCMLTENLCETLLDMVSTPNQVSNPQVEAIRRSLEELSKRRPKGVKETNK